ncbi:MAG: cobyrinate a,c-diamide synthase [Bacillota bacterium]
MQPDGTSGRGWPFGPVPRLVIAAPHGGSGKTTVTLGLVAALAARGLTVQPFKKGPDYIDPGWLGKAAGRPCRNLDRFFCTPDQLVAAFVRGARGADVAVIEGNHGLYDGLDMEGSGSTAEVARVLAAPVILVLDTTRMTRSVAALVRGFQDFDPGIRIAGVILNRAAGPRHRSILTASLEKYCRVPVLGLLPNSRELSIPVRHLGLVPAAEAERQERILEWGRWIAAKHLDLEGILAVARSAGELPPAAVPAAQQNHGATEPAALSRVRIGYFADVAFHFYYPENLEALAAAGAELVTISPLADPDLPPVDALYLGGGFPELVAGSLAANGRFRVAVQQAVKAGMPVYAECGGLMYLCRTLVYQGVEYEMAGALPADVVVEPKPQGHGYTLMEVAGENPFFPVGAVIRGHEFHYSRLVNLDRSQTRFAYRVRKGTGIDGQHDGLVYRNVLAGYNHLYALAVPGWAEALVSRAVAYRKARGAAARG